MTAAGGTSGDRVVLDWASTQPLRPAARDAMVRALETTSADPGRVYQEALASRHTIESSREVVAAALGARPSEVVFTSGATESINAVTRFGRRDGQVFGAVEHAAVRLGAEHGWFATVGADSQGRIDAGEVWALAERRARDAIGEVGDRSRAVVCHLQWANQEVGVLQPVARLGELAAAATPRHRVLVHSDAAMAVGRVPVDFGASGAALMSVSSHKLGGPAGVGALVVARGRRIGRILEGGDQERARRAGMENTVGIVGFAAAIDEAVGELDRWHRHTTRLTDSLRAWCARRVGLSVLGPDAAQDRLPDLVCLAVEGVEPQALVQGLDRRGFAVHSGSSCASESLEPSPVLAAMGVDAQRSLRISVGTTTKLADVERFCAATDEVLAELRSLGNVSGVIG